MDRATLLDHLALALRNVAQAKMHIAQQRENVATLERLGLDTSAAKVALLQFEELQAMHVADRDRLKKELDESHPPAPTHLEELDLLSFWPREKK
jgi:Flp pilus assembly protein CpaB